MRLTPSRKLLTAAAAAAVPAAMLAASVATPAAAATAAKTTLSISAAHSAVLPHAKDTIRGVLRSSGHGIAGQTVRLRERQAGTKAWSSGGTALTNAKGAVSFSVAPPHRREQYQLVFARTSAYQASHSAVVTVTVKNGTSLTISAAHGTVKPRTKDRITGMLRSGRTGLTNQHVTLRERKYGTKKWTVLTSGTTGTGGRVTFSITPPNSKEQYELVYAGTTRYFGSHSGVTTITVA